ncbi:aquaporin-11 [Octodon degus]|uniref:Aquaporin-11 n=1 Tax=Octodon degus TaxID=10160 RepID=A0A6P3F5U2_OCTDE|nr:aquaporin-11 [Octodon degus]
MRVRSDAPPRRAQAPGEAGSCTGPADHCPPPDARAQPASPPLPSQSPRRGGEEPGREGRAADWDSQALPGAAVRRGEAMSALPGLRPEVRDSCASLGFMLLVVLLVGLARAGARKRLHRPAAHAFVSEFLGTLQLCCCTHELLLLSEQDSAHPTWTLTLVYFFSLVHGLTLAGTSSNPCSLMMQIALGGMAPEMGALRLLAQLASALGSRYCMRALWSLGLTRYHFGERIFDCRNPVQSDLPKAVMTEAICCFIFHSALLQFQEVRARLRVHLLAAVITFLAYAGGSLTGALFNPALALSLHFVCFDEAFSQFFTVYWLAPSVGILLMILMFSFLPPWLNHNQIITKKE